MADNLLIINKNYDFFFLKLKRNHVLTRLLPDLYVTFSDPLFLALRRRDSTDESLPKWRQLISRPMRLIVKETHLYGSADQFVVY